MRRLLVIDDEPAMGRLVKRVAEGCGFAVTVTHHADEFLSDLELSQPEVIVLDLSLPELDGIELLRLLSASCCRAEILIISGFDPRVLETSGRLGLARGLNVIGTLMKPVRVAELRAALCGTGRD
jgi:DNA-binding response OmpR family regulator